MSDETKGSREFELKKLEFEKSLDQRNFEIDNFWKRGWFFGALLVVLATGYFKLIVEKEEYCIYISFLGFLVSFFQAYMNRGSKYWQERWENKTKNRESVLNIDVTKTKRYAENEKYYLDAGTLAKRENFFTVARRFSVSKLTFLIWDIVTISWFLLWIDSCHFDFSISIRRDAAIFHAVIILYIFVFFWNGKVYERFTKEKGSYPAKNFRQPHYDDSESYYRNEVNEDEEPQS